MKGGIFKYLMDSGFDMERIGTAKDYFEQKHYRRFYSEWGEESLDDGIEFFDNHKDESKQLDI